MPKTKPQPSAVDAYLARVPAAQRTALEKLRRTIRSAAPKAEECLSYGLAAFRHEGRPLVAFGAWKDHCALYPMSSAVTAGFAEELAGFGTSKGTIRFAPGQPLPAALVRRLVRARLAENAESSARRAAKRAARKATQLSKT